MRVIRARKAGFCMGVGLALRKLDEAVARRADRGGEEKIATLGDIIHNPQVLDHYARQGVLRLDSPAETEPGMTVLIRAHGVPHGVEADLRAAGVDVVDATCPRVKAAQLAIARATADGSPLLLYGDVEHPEVRGLVSYASGPALVFASPEELRVLLAEERLKAGRVVLAAQTTQDRPVFDALRKDLYITMNKRLVVLDTICDATRQRQEEALRLAGQVDAMVVVGGRKSGNTRRLAEMAAASGVPTLLVETESEVEPGFFAQTSAVGLTAGASTPKSLVDAVEKRLLQFP